MIARRGARAVNADNQVQVNRYRNVDGETLRTAAEQCTRRNPGATSLSPGGWVCAAPLELEQIPSRQFEDQGKASFTASLWRSGPDHEVGGGQRDSGSRPCTRASSASMPSGLARTTAAVV